MSNQFTKQDVTQLISELVQISSEYFDENAVMKFAFDWLQQQGLNPEIHHYQERNALEFDGQNVIVRLKGKNKGKKVCLNGHLDTVPLCEGWTKPPSDAVIENDRLYGVGALDMKSGCAANMLALAQFFADYGNNFSGEIVFSLVSDEEGPFGLGTNALIEDGVLDGIDIALVTEPTAGFSQTQDFPLLCLGARGCLVFYVEFIGKAAHASTPELGVNAAIEASKFVLSN